MPKIKNKKIKSSNVLKFSFTETLIGVHEFFFFHLIFPCANIFFWYFARPLISFLMVRPSDVTIETLRNYDDDGKAIGLMSKTTTLHVHDAFLYISLLFLHNYDVKWDQMLSLLENRNGKSINSSISVWTRARAPLFISNQNSILSSNRANWDNREKN